MNHTLHAYIAHNTYTYPQEYTDKADIWSIGVVAYVLLCGFPPFNAGSEGLTYNIVKEGNVKFPSPAWDKISPGAIHFIKRLLDKDPDSRPSAAQALEDPWLTHEKVNPFSKFLWHGTFLSKQSAEAELVEVSKQIVYAAREKQSAFEKILWSRKKKKNINRDSNSNSNSKRSDDTSESRGGFRESMRSFIRGETRSSESSTISSSSNQ